jgi:hypothetical protein
MRYLIIFLMLAIVYIGLTGCSQKQGKYGLKGFFNVKVKNEK